MIRMVVRKQKKIFKKRGQRSPGRGHHKRSRGGGSRGGRGNAGLSKHKKFRAIKYMPDHFGKKGFKRPQKMIKKPKPINLKDLDKKVEELLKEKKIKEDKSGIKVNLTELGYDKLLGTGKIKHKLIIEGKYFSQNAKKKIEESKGKVIVVS